MVPILLILVMLVIIVGVTFAYGISEPAEESTTTAVPVVIQDKLCPTQEPVVIRQRAERIPVNKKYIGCFASYGNPLRDLDSLSPVKTISTDECAGLAREKNYRYFTILDGQCKGSNDTKFASEVLQDQDCMWSCDQTLKPSNTIACGANKNVASVFENGDYIPNIRTEPQEVPHAYKGCYVDREEDRALPHLLSASVPSVGSCARLAHDSGMKFFGIQGHGQCWGGHTLFDATKHGLRDSDAYCRWACNTTKPYRTDDVESGTFQTNAVYQNLFID